MGFLKKYLSSRTEFEDESGIKKDQKKELVMWTLLRISDRKLKLADNRFYADELLGRIKTRLKLEHDSCLDPVQVPRLPTIIQFIKNITKTTHLLIIIYLALFKEHQAAGEEEVLRVEESAGICTSSSEGNPPGELVHNPACRKGILPASWYIYQLIGRVSFRRAGIETSSSEVFPSDEPVYMLVGRVSFRRAGIETSLPGGTPPDEPV
ncbi:hypothetical protein PGT21_023714 [Puccinia graminis f. sp. tritici]|uniref:Uncharacterized protein n=1 Tax=Puccinia graminis f. sp. tritici TaxID=56615 RepID=A0A5B0PSI3_PUCGR|nr:hypothetical protein PGTUg99_001688 [Puccinia graminis f. sp. tritici]KAA1108738.1 hypothetical protein PGT21_023714 [Puccinia graminis f. sp. tritici]